MNNVDFLNQNKKNSLKGVVIMYVGRDMTELSMTPKNEWQDRELAFFHHSLQQMAQYLNSEGLAIHKDIIKEIERRGGLQRQEATYTSGTFPTID